MKIRWFENNAMVMLGVILLAGTITKEAASAPITYTFASPGQDCPQSAPDCDIPPLSDIAGDPLVYGGDGTGKPLLTATGAVYRSGGLREERGVAFQDITPANGGLGVRYVRNNGNLGGGDQIDRRDRLTLTFEREVFLTDVTINRYDHQDFSGPSNIRLNGVVYTTFNGVLTFANALKTSVLEFEWASNWSRKYHKGSYSQYYLASITTVVPVPAALPLLASALAGLGFIGYRRRRQGTISL